MVDADLVDGRELGPLIERFFAKSDVAYPGSSGMLPIRTRTLSMVIRTC